MKTVSMMASTAVVVFLSGTALAQATAFRGGHIGFVTASGQAGDQIDLRTGYLTSGAPETEAWSYQFQTIAPGVRQLQTRTQRFSANPNATFAQASFNLLASAPGTRIAAEGGGVSAVAGWYAQSSMTTDPVTERQTFNPTSGDAFVATGTLAGGNFAYEIMSVTALNGSSPASFAIGMLTNPAGNTNNANRQLRSVNAGLDVFGIYDQSQAGGGALSDRSIFMGNGQHFHGWGFFISQRGTYEVTMRVYDTTGKFAASDAFTFQVNSVPTPSALGLLGAAGLIAGRRRRA